MDDDEEDELWQSRNARSYPHVFLIAVTHAEFPSSCATLDRSGMPYGCMLTPFIARTDAYSRQMRRAESAAQVARCSVCKAYMNPFCDFSALQWTCSLCNSRNPVARSMDRYRQGDIKTLEEAQCILVDYLQPFRTLDGCPARLDGKLGVPCAQRPLVHVLLIQESMPFESLQCLIESLCEVLGSMHPDVRVLLVTFSHRLCIYSLDPLAPTVHRIPFVNSATLEASAAAAVTPTPHDYRAKTGIKGRYVDLVPQRPAAQVVDFFDAARPLGACQETAQTALQHIHEAFAEETSGEQQRNMAIDDETDELQGHHEYLYAPPEAMLGPALEAVQQWITSPYRGAAETKNFRGQYRNDGSAESSGDHADDDEDDEDEEVGAGPRRGFASNLYGIVSSVAQGFMRDILGTSPGVEASPATAQADDKDAKSDYPRIELGKAAADHCSGVFLHIFVSGPQDLPEGAHESVPSNVSPVIDATRGGKKPLEVLRPGLDRAWVQDIAERFVRRAVCVNIWGVCNFDSQRLGLAALAPLAQQTGGSIAKTALGVHPAREQLHLTEQLRRCMSSQQLASRGVLRLRFSPVVEFSDEGVTGHLKEDAEFPGVYRIAGCTPTNTFAVQLAYKNNDGTLNPSERNNKLVLQMAFSYDTLVEGAARAGTEQSGDATGPADPAELTDPEDYSDTAATILGLDAEMQYLRTREGAKMDRKGIVKHPDVRRVGAMHGASGDASGCAYDRSKNLVAVRRLRVFTVTLQCTHRIPRLIQVANHTTIAVLLARLASVKHSRQSLDGGKAPSPSSAGMLEAWAATLLAVNAASLKAVNTTQSAALDQAISQAPLRRLLLMLYGATHSLDLHALLNPSSAVELASPLAARTAPSAAMASARLSVCETDAWIVLQSALATNESYHTFKILYPICHPLNADNCVINHNLALTREAMTMSSAPAFLIDSGVDLVLYKNMPSRPKPQPSVASVLRAVQPSATTTTAAAPPPAPDAAAAETQRLPVLVGIKALNILARNHHGQGHTAEHEAAAEEKTLQHEEEVRNVKLKKQQEVTDASRFELFARDPDWLPCVLRRRLMASAIIPRIYHAESGQASAAVLSSKLIEDAQARGGSSSDTFLARIKQIAADQLAAR